MTKRTGILGRLLPAALALIAVLLVAACSGDDDDSGDTAAPTDVNAPAEATETETDAPEPEEKLPPLIGGFYKGEAVTYLLTDVSTEADAAGLSEATGYPVTFVASLGDVPDSATAKLYLFMNGVEGPNPFGFQANVIDSIPGDPGYSPLWRVHAVLWSDAATPVELKSEEDILAAESAGDLTVERAPLVKNSPVVDEVPPLVGGFHNGDPVDYFLTDVSGEQDAADLSDATGFPVTFVPSLGDIPASLLAKLYLFMNGVDGPNPFGFQANVVDSLPGDENYSPLWLVHAVKWTDSATPRLLTSEADILEAEAAGELAIEVTPLVKNSPVVGN